MARLHIPGGTSTGQALCYQRDVRIAHELAEVTCQKCLLALRRHDYEVLVGEAVVALAADRDPTFRAFAVEILNHRPFEAWGCHDAAETVADRIAKAHARAAEDAERLRRVHLKAQALLDVRAKPKKEAADA